MTANTFLDSVKRNWKWLVAVLVIIIAAVVFYYWWKKRNEQTVTIVDDSGNPAQITQQDTATAATLAAKLKDDINGVNILGHDDALYQQLLQQSNTVFALTFGKYKELTGAYLTDDLNGEFFGTVAFPGFPVVLPGWDIVDTIINRANDLNIR